jgi:hypothetical protein
MARLLEHGKHCAEHLADPRVRRPRQGANKAMMSKRDKDPQITQDSQRR